MNGNDGAITYNNFLYALNCADKIYSKDFLLEKIKTKYNKEVKIEDEDLEQDFLLKAKLELAQAVCVLESGDRGKLLVYSDKLARDLLYNSINDINGVYQRNCIFFRDNAKYKQITREYNSAIDAIKKFLEMQVQQNNYNEISFQEDEDDEMNLNRKRARIATSKQQYNQKNNDSNEYNEIIYRAYEDKDRYLSKTIEMFKEKIVNIVKDSLCSCTGKGSVMTK